MSDTAETVATYELAGQHYEIDHLGICRPLTQWGQFAVYRDGEQVAEFSIKESILLGTALRPAELPVSREELVRLAQDAVVGS